MTDIFLPLPYVQKNPRNFEVPAFFNLGTTSETVEFAKVITLTSTFIPFECFEVIITGYYEVDDYGWHLNLGQPISSNIRRRAEKAFFSLSPREQYRNLSEDEYYDFFPDERELYFN